MVIGPLLLLIFLASIVLLLVLIIRFRVNPFLALLVVSVLTAFTVGMPLDEIGGAITTGFGNTLSGIGIVIGLGIVLGKVLVESRAAEQVANKLLDLTGYERSPLAINITGYLASIPVFLDAAFVIFVPLVRQISRKTGKPWVTYVTALSVGLIATHAMVIPTPGPLAVAENMQLDVGFFLLYAIVASLPAALIGGWLYGLWIGRSAPPAGPETAGYAAPDAESEVQADARADAAGPVPPGGLSIGVLLLPVLLILFGSIFGLLLPAESLAGRIVRFVGDKNIALLLGVFVAFGVLRTYIRKRSSEIVTEAGAAAGLILLITGAGGAFGNVLNAGGIGPYLVETMSNWSVPLTLLAFLLSALLRIAQGSTTVALITTSAIVGPTIAATGASPVLVGLAVCAGGMCCSLPNDSGFWVVSRFADLSVRETLRAWTVGGTLAGIVAFLVVLVLGLFQGFLPGL